MKAMTSFTLRSLAKNRARTVVSVIGIMLSCALITAIFTSVASLQQGLEQRTAATEGTWHIFGSSVPTDTLDALVNSGNVTDVVVSREIGSAPLTEAEASQIGSLLTVRTLPVAEKGAIEQGSATFSVMPEIEEGRMPETAGEIVLPDYVKGTVLGEGAADASATSDGSLAVGSTVTVSLGARTAETADGAVVLDSVYGAAYDAEGRELPVSFENVQERTYTVVGFYERQGFIGNDFAAASGSAVALASADEEGVGADLTLAWATTQGFTSLSDMQAFAANLPGAEKMERSFFFHNNLFRYLGISDGSSIMNTLMVFAVVLAAVIVAASISLIHNSFSISIAERTRQFGLLRSIGASAKQLRRSVLFEALLLGVVGIPLGVAAGIGGTYAVFAATQGAFALMFYSDAGVSVALEPVPLALAALLSLVTLLLSAWQPARRAGRVSAIDAIRQTQDVRLSRRERRRARKQAREAESAAIQASWQAATASSGAAMTSAEAARSAAAAVAAGRPGAGRHAAAARRDDRSVFADQAHGAGSGARSSAPASAAYGAGAFGAGPAAVADAAHIAAAPRARHGAVSAPAPFTESRGVFGRLFKLPGLLAHRNLSRASMRGRTVVASLAMSVALLVITGSVALYFDPIESRASTRAGVTANADVSVSFHTSGGEDLASYEADMASAADEATALGAERVGSFRQGQFEGVIPASMVTQAGRDTIEYREDATAMTGATWIAPPFTSQGDFAGAVTTFFIDDASWRAWVAELGLDEEAFCDPENPQAIALNHFTGTGPAGVYTDVAPFAATGEITMCYGVQPREGYTSLGVQEGENGELVIAYLKQEEDGYAIDENGNAIGAEVVEVPVDEGAQTATLVVGALADDAPAVLSVGYPTGSLPTVILPISAAEAFVAAVGGEAAASAQAGDSYDYAPSPFTYWWGTELFAAENHAEVADALDGAIASTGALSEGLSAQVNDITEEAEQNRMVSQAIQLFLLCFSVITMLVAVANVFNTLTNSIILRTREFAVLKSVGMDDKAFARMLLCECASYALRGFVAGVVIALGVTGLLYWATSLSFAGLSFAVPWAYVGAAAVVVCLVLAASVVFALHKSHAGSVVEALRAEAV